MNWSNCGVCLTVSKKQWKVKSKKRRLWIEELVRAPLTGYITHVLPSVEFTYIWMLSLFKDCYTNGYDPVSISTCQSWLKTHAKEASEIMPNLRHTKVIFKNNKIKQNKRKGKGKRDSKKVNLWFSDQKLDVYNSRVCKFGQDDSRSKASLIYNSHTLVSEVLIIIMIIIIIIIVILTIRRNSKSKIKAVCRVFFHWCQWYKCSCARLKVCSMLTFGEVYYHT